MEQEEAQNDNVPAAEEAQNDNLPAAEVPDNEKEEESGKMPEKDSKQGVDPEELAAKLRELEEEVPEEEVSEEQDISYQNVPSNSRVSGELGIEETEVEEEETGGVTRISIHGISPPEYGLEDEDSEELRVSEVPIIYGNIRMFLKEYQVLEKRKEPVPYPDPFERLYLQDAMKYKDCILKDLSIGVESVWWKEKMGCGQCPSNITCSCGLTLPEILINLSQYFHLIVIPDKTCTTCLQILDEIRHRDVEFCQISLEDIEETKKADLRNFLEIPGNLSLRVLHHWSHESSDTVLKGLLNEKLPEYFDIIVIGTSTAARGISHEAYNCKLSVCLVEVPKVGSDSFWGFENSNSFYVDAMKMIFLEAADVQKAFKHGKYNGLDNTDKGFFDWEMFRNNARRYLESLAWHYRVGLQKEGTLYVTGVPYVTNKNTVQVKLPFGDTLELHGKNIILAMGGKMEYDHFPGLHRYCYKVEKLLSIENFGVSKVLICGGDITILEFGEIFHSFGMDVTLMMDSSFPRKYDSDILKLLMDYMEGNGVNFVRNCRVLCVQQVVSGANGTVTIPDVNEKLMVIGKNLESGKFTKYFVDNVIVLPRSATWSPVSGLTDIGVNFCKFNPDLVLVDDNLRTSVSNIYAVGAAVLGMQDPGKQFEITGKYLVQYISGKISKVPKLDRKLGQLLTRPEYCFYGLSESAANESYDDVTVYQLELPVTNPFSAVPREPPSYGKLICRKRLTHRNNLREDIIGLHVIGRIFAPEVVRGFSIPLSEGMTKEQLDEMVGVQCSTAQALIGMTELKYEEDPLISQSSKTSEKKSLGDEPDSEAADNETVSKSADNDPVIQLDDNETDPKSADNDAVPKSADNGPVPESVDKSIVSKSADNETVSKPDDNETV